MFSVRVADGRRANLSASADDDLEAAPSPAGRLVAFTREAPAGNGVWLMNADGSAKRLLAPGGSRPVWSRDGRTIAYNGPGPPGSCPPEAFRCGHAVTLRAVRVDGSGARVVATAARDASWSPDGRRLAYEADIDPYGSSSAIEVANADGTNVRTLVRGGQHSPVSPAWSPSGRLIAYSLAERIHVVRPDGTGRRRIANGIAPSWSPNGASLAHLGRLGKRSSAYGLVVTDARGRARRVLARRATIAAW
ncbi:MAG: PD40 domain-containing protein, partial [Thermoleophilia bacterium]|nr:PD40 domain-containing protein [Thermoleophilia bacterium]